MSAPKLKESGKRICGINLLSNCKTRQRQMKYLMENMKEPDFSLIECSNSLNNTFGINDEVLNTAGITFRILNSQGFGNGSHSSNALPTWGSVAHFMANIQDYLPKSLRTKQNPHRLWSHRTLRNNDTQIIAEDTQELLNDMCDWLEMMKRKIEDYITARYFREGKVNHLETLKRRFKNDWAERVEQQVDATTNTDMTINIKFEDYTEDGNNV